jgi:hypothetical protein
VSPLSWDFTSEACRDSGAHGGRSDARSM